MITVAILEPHDVIASTDHVRQLSLIQTGQSDHVATLSTYGGGRINRLGWMRAAEVCPAWVGKPVGQFNAAMTPQHRHQSEACLYEFIRGDVPNNHVEPGKPVLVARKVISS